MDTEQADKFVSIRAVSETRIERVAFSSRREQHRRRVAGRRQARSGDMIEGGGC